MERDLLQGSRSEHSRQCQTSNQIRQLLLVQGLPCMLREARYEGRILPALPWDLSESPQLHKELPGLNQLAGANENIWNSCQEFHMRMLLLSGLQASQVLQHVSRGSKRMKLLTYHHFRILLSKSMRGSA